MSLHPGVHPGHPGGHPGETDHPHLTLAAGLKPHQFDAAWGLLEPHTHTSTERVTEVVLLKRVLLPGERYGLVRSFPLSSDA